ncbi:MAG TPA: NADH-quinone oxidoreductase subunit NuoN [Dermatophilaceae bacterium]|nr:NADH-quinone oxidoreductase subunit NuoN [Dermatophilaceae bacterium]
MSEVSYSAILPILIVFGGAVLGVLVEAFLPRRRRHGVQLSLAAGSLVAAFVALLLRSKNYQGVTLSGALVIDGPALMLQGVLILLGLIGILIMAERFTGRTADAFTPSGASVPGSKHEGLAERLGSTTEVFPLALFSVAGMMMFPAAGDLLTMFVALEVLSLPLYVLTGLARRRRLLSQEAALKYFLLGSFSSAFFLFGASLLYGFAGSVNLSVIAEAIGTATGRDGLLVPGVLFILVGLLFKVGAVPFHSWTPDVYLGAPTPVTGFMAACTKAAAFGALLRVTYVGVAGSRWDWQAAVWVVAALTMIVGAVLAVAQLKKDHDADLKRLLAYSSIAHAGFILVGLVAFDRSGVSSVLFYLVAYGFATTAAFGIITIVRLRDDGSEVSILARWAGLGRRSPAVAGAFAFLLMAFAGIPLTSGFTAKFAVFAAAVAHAGAPGVVLAVIGVLSSAVTAYVYFRIIVVMFFTDPADDSVVVWPASVATTAAIAVGLLVTLGLGVFPAPVLDLATNSALFLR